MSSVGDSYSNEGVEECFNNDVERSGGHNILTEEIVFEVHNTIFIIGELTEEFVDLNCTTIYNIVMENLEFHKLCAK